MAPELAFATARPGEMAAHLDGDVIHLWRMAYAREQGRAPLLAVLAGYLGVDAADVVLQADAGGKPRLAMAPARCGGLEFNWSHSGQWALLAVARHVELGVDIERLDKELRALEIARRFFAPAEAETLASLAAPARERAFTGLWCAKEAVLKGAGTGLSFGLARLAFGWRGGMEWELQQIDPDLGVAGHWQLAGFEAAPGYRGALAWRGGPRRLATFRPPSPDGC